MKTGRIRPAAPPKLYAEKYLRPLVLTKLLPDSLSYANNPFTREALSHMFMNDQLGCCVIAAAFHSLGIATGNAPPVIIPPDADVVKDYSAISGYVPGDESTDVGCNEVTAFKFFQTTGLPDGSKLVGWFGLDATNQTTIKQALYLCECLFLTLELPDAWVNNPPKPGFVWKPSGPGNPNLGHAIMAYGWSKLGLLVSTWGMTGIMTWPAVAQYCSAKNGGMIYGFVLKDIINRANGRAPDGLNWAQLIKDIDALGANIPVPNAEPCEWGAPPVAPPPAPPTIPGGVESGELVVVTLGDAIKWATSMLPMPRRTVDGQRARMLVQDGLTKNWPKS